MPPPRIVAVLRRRTLFSAAIAASALALLPEALSSSSAAAAVGRPSPGDSTRPLVFGVSGHDPQIDGHAYPAHSARAQLALAASLGLQSYRVDWRIPEALPDATDWSWYDDVVEAAEQRSMSLLAVLTPPDGHMRSWYRDRVAALVSRYAGRVAAFQIENERDNEVILGPQVDGSRVDHFDRERYEPVRDRMAAITQGVRDGDPTARTAVTIAITELNSSRGSVSGVAQDEELQIERLDSVLTAPQRHAPPELRSVFFYELLDQRTAPAAEADFGLVRVAADGTWGRPKPVADLITRFVSTSNW